LIEHKEQWPKEVILREGDRVSCCLERGKNGRVVESAGAKVAVKVTEITKEEVGADYMGGNAPACPFTATDLPVRAAAGNWLKQRAKRGQGRGESVHQSRDQRMRLLRKVRESEPRRKIRTGLGAPLYAEGNDIPHLRAPT